MDIRQSEGLAARRRIPFRMVNASGAGVTGLVIALTNIKLSKAGAAEANATGSVTEIGAGSYYYEAVAAEVDTLGFLLMRVLAQSTALEVNREVSIIHGPVFGAVVADGTNDKTRFKTDLTASVVNAHVNKWLVFTSGPNDKEGKLVGAFDPVTDFITVIGALPSTPATGNTFELISR